MVLTVVLFCSLGGSSSTSRFGFIGCAGTGRVMRIVVCAGAGRVGVIAGFVVFVDSRRFFRKS